MISPPDSSARGLKPSFAPRRTRLRIVVAATCAVVLTAIPISGTALAHSNDTAVANQTNDSSHPWQSNGCGPSGFGWLVADSTAVTRFNHACDHHDGCYGGYGHGNWVSRRTCDDLFLRDMRSSCQVQFGSPGWFNVGRASCDSVANLYYRSVRWFGAVAYDGPINN